jgi:hypothetical protein
MDSAKTSFCVNIGCFGSKLVSKDTLVMITIITYGDGFDRTREVGWQLYPRVVL